MDNNYEVTGTRNTKWNDTVIQIYNHDNAEYPVIKIASREQALILLKSLCAVLKVDFENLGKADLNFYRDKTAGFWLEIYYELDDASDLIKIVEGIVNNDQ